ncbi:phosphoribosyl-AMP cyclohydrolase, partial [Bacillus thuringiensis]
MNVDDLTFDDKGLIPAVVQDAQSKEVVTLAYMNRESFEKTVETGETWFYSRSRQELWHKGATSGHTQKVVDIRYDCDGDALV